jgi:enterochelin esterase family protein
VALIALLSAMPGRVEGQGFSVFVSRVESAPYEQRSALVDSFLAAVGDTPLVEEDSVVTYVYRGAGSTVNVPGDANWWNASAGTMTRLSSTDLFYRTEIIPPDARLDYKFVLDGSTWILDPRNPFQVVGGFGPNSELRMPRYVPPPEIDYRPGIPHGQFHDTTLFSSHLGNTRPIRIYVPPGYAASSDSFPVMLVHDGLEYISLASANNTLDFLTSERRIRPVIVVFVPPVNRSAEYAGSQMAQFTAFVVSELMPFVDARFRTRRSPAQRATLGASNGGNISLWLAVTHPELFGNAAAQSSVVQSGITSAIQGGAKLPVRFYLDIGTYETPLLGQVRDFVRVLQGASYDLFYREYHEGHSWGSWRAHIDGALQFFFPGEALGLEGGDMPHPSRVSLGAYPNPFNPSTTIEVQGADGRHCRLTVYDLLGREVALLVDGAIDPGPLRARFDPPAGLASGVYIVRLTAGTWSRALRVFLLR